MSVRKDEGQPTREVRLGEGCGVVRPSREGTREDRSMKRWIASIVTMTTLLGIGLTIFPAVAEDDNKLSVRLRLVVA